MSTAIYINTVEAKEEFAELINRVSHHKDRIILLRRDKEVAAIIPIEDLQSLQVCKDKSDLDEAVSALNEARKQGTLPLEALKETLKPEEL